MEKYTKPNFNRCAVITIDTQNDFSLPGAVAEIKGTNAVIPRMKLILDAARASGIPIIHVVRLYMENGSNVDLCRKELIESGVAIVRPGTKGAELVEEIMPADAKTADPRVLLEGGFPLIGPSEWMMYKPRWGAFYQTGLETFLRDKDIDTLIFIGCNFPNCPRTSIYQASERDFKLILVEDSLSGVYEQGIAEMKNIGVRIYQTQPLLNELQQ
ncbi:cysteine hydrolase family protein [Paenibacillus glycanilyticus]|uniref:cysteine hydrolase family protein n=1 Tax=Paenibacillus glycanilyticus TaxID=126569 RepID=UPI0019106757|nr:isochorismatase family cysteine hydrolase [Paenibacillus glycanilyticus]